MLQTLPPIRTECPPGACDCQRDALLGRPESEQRILRLTKEEEKQLIARIEAIDSYDKLKRMQAKLHENLGVTLHIGTSGNEVRTSRGFDIRLGFQPGLCRKTRAAIPSAFRRCIDSHPEIAWAILDAEGLFGAP
jgi:hypothetical protein